MAAWETSWVGLHSRSSILAPGKSWVTSTDARRREIDTWIDHGLGLHRGETRPDFEPIGRGIRPAENAWRRIPTYRCRLQEINQLGMSVDPEAERRLAAGHGHDVQPRGHPAA